MTLRIGLWVSIVVLAAVRQADGQGRPWQGPPQDPRRPAVEPRQTLPPYQAQPPRAPSFQRRPDPQPPRPPFVLTPQQQAQVDWVLSRWEQQNRGVKHFECKITRFEEDRVFQRKLVDEGRIWYSAPDKGRFEIDGERQEKWICDGKSVYEYSYQKKQLIQHELPPEMQGKAIQNGPMPFLFGATAASLKQRYFLRLVQPPQGTEGQIWLEAYPATQQDLANFTKAELILTTDGMQPFALGTTLPNGNHTTYRLTELKVNPTRLLGGIFGNDPFRATKPKGWELVVEPAPTSPTRIDPPEDGRLRPVGTDAPSAGYGPPPRYR